MEYYKIPDGLNPCVISENIKTALLSMDYHGPVVSVHAYCNETNQIHEEEDGFLAAGMKLKRVPEGRKGKDHSRDMRILADMWFWAMDNRQPSNLMVISDNLFAPTVNELKARNYNVIWTKLSAQGMPITHQSWGSNSQRIENDH